MCSLSTKQKLPNGYFAEVPMSSFLSELPARAVHHMEQDVSFLCLLRGCRVYGMKLCNFTVQTQRVCDVIIWGYKKALTGRPLIVTECHYFYAY